MQIQMFYVSTFVALLLTVALTWGLVALKKKNPEKTIGDVINFIFLRDKVSFNVMGLIIVNLAEAYMAASISPNGEFPINPVARFLGHFVIAIVGISMGLGAIAGLTRLKQVEKKQRLDVVITTIFTLLCAIAIPYLNAMLIASGLRQMNTFALFVRGDITRALSSGNYPMNTTLVMTLVHYILLAADAFSILKGDVNWDKAIIKGLGAKTEASEIDKKITKKGEEAEQSQRKSANTLIEGALKRYRFQNPSDFEQKKKRSIEIKDAMDDKDRAKLTNNLISLEKTIADLDKSKKDATEERRAEINTEIYNKINDFWQNSTENGKGFGMTLPAKGGKN